MLRILQHETLEEASRDLLGFATSPQNWIAPDGAPAASEAMTATAEPDYQRAVGPLCVSASVRVNETLLAHLHISFRAPGLTPVRASDHLAVFLRAWMPLIPNCEWQVETDGRWVHFRRQYVGPSLQA